MYTTAGKIDLSSLRFAKGSTTQKHRKSEEECKHDLTELKRKAIMLCRSVVPAEGKRAIDCASIVSIISSTENRYKLTKERIVLKNTVGDYCTILLFTLSLTDELPTRSPAEVADAFGALMVRCVDNAEALATQGVEYAKKAYSGDHTRMEWMLGAMFKMSDAWEFIKMEDVEAYTACVKSFLCLILATIRREYYKEANVVVPAWVTHPAGGVSPKFVDAMDPRICGLINSVNYIQWLTHCSGPAIEATVENDFRDNVMNWVRLCHANADYDQFLTSVIDLYLEYYSLPGECFYYNKKTLFDPNFPREALQVVRPPIFQEVGRWAADNISTVFELLKEQTPPKFNAPTSSERVKAKCVELAIIVSATMATCRDCGITIQNRFATYSQYECYGKATLLQKLEWPAVFKTGSFFILAEKNPDDVVEGAPFHWCKDALTAVVWLVRKSAEHDNDKANVLLSSWSK